MKCKLAHAILLLDWIPRYGRIFTLRSDDIDFILGVDELEWNPPEWRWQKRGLWGFNLLAKLGWLSLCYG